MNEEIDTKNCRLAGDMLHIQFTNGESYVFSLGEIVEQCAGGLTPREPDKRDSSPSQAFSQPEFLSDLEGLS